MAGERRCQNCGSTFIHCYHREVGGVDYEDEYTIFCKSCKYTDNKTLSGGSPVSGNWETDCPYCGKSCHGHPSELNIIEMDDETGDFMWRVGENPIVHKIEKVTIEETPAGTEGQEYTAFCGESLLSWSQVCSVSKKADSIPPKSTFCPDCFPGYLA